MGKLPAIIKPLLSRSAELFPDGLLALLDGSLVRQAGADLGQDMQVVCDRFMQMLVARCLIHLEVLLKLA